MASPWPAPLQKAPNFGCLGNYSALSFCDASLPLEERARLLSEMLTPSELVSFMNDEMPAVARLGIPAYRYGHEGLHGALLPCIEYGTGDGVGHGTGRCFTDFPSSSAIVASFNRSLWFHTGSAEADEQRGIWLGVQVHIKQCWLFYFMDWGSYPR